MGRIRTIKPEFWESESVGRLSIGARLLFLACLNMADDEGLLRWNEAYLSSQAFVYDELPLDKITEWMRELVSESIVFPYKSSIGQRLGWIVNFRKHQVINRPQPGKLPAPSIQNRDVQSAIFLRDGHICHLCGTTVDLEADPSLCKSKAPSLDHLTPKCEGGSDYPSNLKTSHISCNKSRGPKPLNESLKHAVNDSVNNSVEEGKGKEKDIYVLPDWIPLEPWNGWIEVRKKKKAPLTARAQIIALRKLEKWRNEGYDLGAILDAATFGNWQGLYIPEGMKPAPKKFAPGDPSKPEDWLKAQFEVTQ